MYIKIFGCVIMLIVLSGFGCHNPGKNDKPTDSAQTDNNGDGSDGNDGAGGGGNGGGGGHGGGGEGTGRNNKGNNNGETEEGKVLPNNNGPQNPEKNEEKRHLGQNDDKDELEERPPQPNNDEDDEEEEPALNVNAVDKLAVWFVKEDMLAAEQFDQGKAFLLENYSIEEDDTAEIQVVLTFADAEKIEQYFGDDSKNAAANGLAFLMVMRRALTKDIGATLGDMARALPNKAKVSSLIFNSADNAKPKYCDFEKGGDKTTFCDFLTSKGLKKCDKK